MTDKPMNKEVISVLACPDCAVMPVVVGDYMVACPECGWQLPFVNQVPVLTDPPDDLVLSKKIERSPNSGTPWRQANWRFLQQQLERLPADAVILDAGAGRGDFATALVGRNTIALDIYPYPEVDLVADLTQLDPFLPESFDAILLLNVLEHVYDSDAMLSRLAKALKPGGVILMAIPFLVKLHQAPVDYVRYTQYALERLGEQHGLSVDSLEGYYDPIFLLGEGQGAIRWTIVHELSGARRYAARFLLAGLGALAGLLGGLLKPGHVHPAVDSGNPSPTGYHVVYRKTHPKSGLPVKNTGQ